MSYFAQKARFVDIPSIVIVMLAIGATCWRPWMRTGAKAPRCW